MSNDDQIVAGLGRLMRDAALEAEKSRDPSKGRARVVDAVMRAHARPTSRRRPTALIAALAAAFVLLAVGGFIVLRPKGAVEFTVEGATGGSSSQSDGGFVQAPPDGWAVIRFSDKSTLALSPGSGGRVHDAQARGARFSVERGEVSVHVAKRDGGADYVIEAGPYAVRVTGTQFDLTWDPNRQSMQIFMREGSVAITGPGAEAGVGLRAGQVMVVSASGGLHISDGEISALVPSIQTAASAVPTQSVAALPPGLPGTTDAIDSATASANPVPHEEHHSGWAERVAAGDFEGVMADAQAKGIDATLAGAPLADVMALADAARYSGHGAVASKALGTVRSRFPGTKSASTAAFLLGRMAEDGGKVDTALGFYEATIGEGGTFGAEALGRKMMLLKRNRGNAAAAPVATSYLSHYPHGPYADAARELVAR